MATFVHQRSKSRQKRTQHWAISSTSITLITSEYVSQTALAQMDLTINAAQLVIIPTNKPSISPDGWDFHLIATCSLIPLQSGRSHIQSNGKHGYLAKPTGLLDSAITQIEEPGLVRRLDVIGEPHWFDRVSGGVRVYNWLVGKISRCWSRVEQAKCLSGLSWVELG